MQVVPAGKDLHVKPIGHELLNYFVDLLRLLRLATPLAKDYVAVDPALLVEPLA